VLIFARASNNKRYSFVTSGDIRVKMWPRTNPFAWDVATLDTESVEPGAAAEHQQQLLAAADQQQQVLAGQQLVMGQQGGRPSISSHFKLPDFWPQAPGLWFARAECRFEMMNVQDSRQMFCFVTDALPYETMRAVRLDRPVRSWWPCNCAGGMPSTAARLTNVRILQTASGRETREPAGGHGPRRR
jgi:hypothetical protein